MINEREKAVFLQKFTNAAAINDGTRYQPDLIALKRDFGHNFNTIHLLNLHTAQKVFVELDQNIEAAIPIPANGGTLSLDWKDGIIFNDLTILNSSGSQIAAGAIILSIGRTGIN